MAVTRDIYADFTEGRLVRSSKDSGYVNFPSPFHEDNLRLVIHPLEFDPSRTPNLGPFAEIDPSGMALTVSIFKSDATLLASQGSWAVSGNTLVGTLNCNTAAMQTAFASSSTTSIPALIEFEFSDADGKVTVQQAITISREYITSGTPAPIPSETYLTESASLSLFVAKAGAAGEGFTLTSPDGTKTIYCYCDNDGVLRSDPVS